MAMGKHLYHQDTNTNGKANVGELPGADRFGLVGLVQSSSLAASDTGGS
jgi:hypothetical protein